jgi:hypothetical protein
MYPATVFCIFRMNSLVYLKKAMLWQLSVMKAQNRPLNPAQSIYCVEKSKAVDSPEEGSNAPLSFGGLVGCGLGWFDGRLVSSLIPELPR